MQKYKGEEQRDRNGQRDNDGRTHIYKKENQHDQDQSHPDQHVFFHRADRQTHQIAAVVIRQNFYVGRQDVLVQLFRFRLDSFQYILGLLAAQHHDDAFDGVVILVESELTQARRVADGDFTHIAHAHRHAILRADDHAADVLHVLDQTQAAHVIKLAALRIKSAAGVGVVHGKLLEHLRDGDVIAVEPRGIEQHLVLHHGAAKAGIIGDAADLFVLAFDHPIFESFQFLRGAIGTLQDVAINQARGAGERRESGRDAGGKVDFAEALKNDLARQIIVGVFIEGQDYIGEPVERDGALNFHLWHAVHFHFGGQSD